MHCAATNARSPTPTWRSSQQHQPQETVSNIKTPSSVISRKQYQALDAVSKMIPRKHVCYLFPVSNASSQPRFPPATLPISQAPSQHCQAQKQHLRGSISEAASQRQHLRGSISQAASKQHLSNKVEAALPSCRSSTCRVKSMDLCLISTDCLARASGMASSAETCPE